MTLNLSENAPEPSIWLELNECLHSGSPTYDADYHTFCAWSRATRNKENSYSSETTFIGSQHPSLEERVRELLSNQVTVVIVNEKGKQTVLDPVKASKYSHLLPEADINISQSNSNLKNKPQEI
jgi:hypothetical protein